MFLTLLIYTHRFLFKFTGQDQEINLLGDGTEKAEFGEWSWISPEQVIELVSIRDDDNFFHTCPKPIKMGYCTIYDLVCLLCAGSGFQETCLQGSLSSVCSIFPIILSLAEIVMASQ